MGCSLVKKDAGMLDAFGKGASDEIREAKDELYRQMTWDPSNNTSMYTEPQSTTPRASPPPSPKPGRALQLDTPGGCTQHCDLCGRMLIAEVGQALGERSCTCGIGASGGDSRASGLA